MGKLKLYDISIPRETIAEERESVYLNRSAEQRFFSLLHLNYISIAMNGGQPLKIPLGKGIIIRRPNS
ncbi:hypothetical protein [Pedobacter punctiformis]|uniref:Uncharacterized protein n=1 Tax=Pedobacter punctiformis TaxID=3004097 RepID=A0ABT4L6W8_9SPHI|nr:hypothetical protein [Pedobacter sp. HCMS5-2]MCZ4243664.1 hypothetical protein [Pedobacter sp. HCMS5-2]